MKVNNFLVLGSLLSFSLGVSAVEKFYFGPNPRDLEINSKEETLFIYPSPPIAQICHPSNIVQMYPVENLSDVQMLNLPQDNSSASVVPKENKVANFLKVVPVQEGKTFCSVKMANGETVNVNLILNEKILRPTVDFKNVSTPTENETFVTDENSDSISIFKKFLIGGKLTQFKDISPGNECFDTEQGHYSINYIGTNDRYKIWTIESKFKNEVNNLPKLKNPKIGEVYYSTILTEKTKKNPKKMTPDLTFYFYILSREDFSIEEMKGVLP